MKKLESLLRALVLNGNTPGLQYLHLNQDAVLYRLDAGVARVAGSVPVTSATTFNGFSVTKTFTAVAILQLVERGLIQLDQPARRLLPTFPYPEAITVRHLLTHTSGLANPIPLRWIHLEPEHGAFDRNAFFARVYASHPKLRAAPNTKFAYTNLGYQLLGELIEHVTGVTYERYVTENILDRVGVSAAQLGFTIDPTVHARGYHKRFSVSYPLLGFLMDRSRSFEAREGAWEMFRLYHMNGAAYGGLVGTVQGFSRLLQSLLDETHLLLTADSVRQLFSEHRLADGKPSGMALSWFVGRLNGAEYVHHAGGGGGYYAELRIYPTRRRASVLLLNRTGMSNANMLDKLDSCALDGVG